MRVTAKYRDLELPEEPVPKLHGVYAEARGVGYDLYEDFQSRKLACIARGRVPSDGGTGSQGEGDEGGSYTEGDESNVVLNPALTILTVDLYRDDQGVNYRRFIFENRAGYALVHGYRYCALHSTLDPSRHPSWQKIPAALLLLPLLKGENDTLVMLDSDAIFVDRRK